MSVFAASGGRNTSEGGGKDKDGADPRGRERLVGVEWHRDRKRKVGSALVVRFCFLN